MSFDLILPFFRPIEYLLLSDTVSEIMVNPDSSVWIEEDGEKVHLHRLQTIVTALTQVVSADLKWSQFSRSKCEPLRSPAVRMHTPALAAIWKPQRSRLRVLQHELSVHTCSSRAIQSCPYCGIPVASIFVSTDREAGRNSSALRTAAPERMQGPWPERWSGWKVLTAGDPTFSRRFT